MRIHSSLRCSSFPVILFLFTFSSILFPASVHSSSYESDSSSISPIRHLEPSLVASAAASTAVAVHSPPRTEGNEYEEECVVLVTRSPLRDRGNNLTLTDPLESDETKYVEASEEGGEKTPRLLPLHTRRGPLFPTNRIIHLLSPTTLTACTGFASDVQHLTRFASSKTSEYETLYGGQGMDVHKVARDVLGERMRQAAFGKGGRPLGVQALVVGASSHGRRRMEGMQLGMYTVDPSGGWLYYGGGGTAVGRRADLVRRNLYSLLNGEESEKDEEKEVGVKGGDNGGTVTGSSRRRPKGPGEALDLAMRALIEANEDRDENGDSIEDDSRDDKDTGNGGGKLLPARYDAVVVFGARGGGRSERNSRPCRFSTVHPKSVTESYWRCIRQLAEEQRATKLRNA